MQALSNWPDATVAGQLLKLAREARRLQRLRALRACIRVAPLPGIATDAQRLALLECTMQLADRDEERRLVLERAAALKTVEALRMVAVFLDQPALAQDAAAAVFKMAVAKDLRTANRQEFQAALRKAIAISKDRAAVERCRQFLQP